MTVTANRFHWADVAKGILIITVVFHHMPQLALSKGWDTAIWNGMNDIRYFYCCFFMATFFLITGYCSNFNKDFKPFLVKSFKSIIVPAISISCLLFILTGITEGRPPLTIARGLGGLIIMLGGNWFLSSLFIARLLYWCVAKLFQSDVIKALVCLIIMVVGFTLHDAGVYNLWFFEHAFAMTAFLFVGDYIHNKYKNQESKLKRVLLIGTCLFIGIWVTLFLTGLRIPSLNAGFKVSIQDIPLYIILSLTGSCLVLYLSMLISECELIEHLGKNSLTIYLFQIFYINIVLTSLHGIPFFVDTNVGQLLAIAISFPLVLLLCLLCSVLLNTKYLKFLLGK